MAGFHVEQAVCHGRDFTAPAGPVLGGMLYYLKVFAAKSLVTGGPGWYIHDDQSALGTDPYIIISSHNAAGPNVPAKYMQILMPTATSAQVRVYYWIYWDPTLHVGRGMYGAHNVRTDDSVDFIYDFRGGPECFFIHTFTTATTWEGSWIDEITLDANLIDNVSATTAVTNYSDNGNIQLRGIDLLAGTMANGLDASGNMHISIEFVSGTSWRVSIYNNTARGGGDLVWRSSNFTALAASTNQTSVTGTAQNSSGVTYRVFLQGATVADATIVFRMNKITVGSGEGAQFVVDNYYTIYDMTVRNAVNSFKVLSKSGDILTIDRVYRPFPIGAKIGSMPHPFFVAGTGSSLWLNRSSIPYYGTSGTMLMFDTASLSGSGSEQTALVPSTLSTTWSSANYYGPHSVASVEDNYITRMSPDRKGRYAVQRPGITERKPFGQSENDGDSVFLGKTGYGQLKNVIVGAVGSMSPNLHGRSLSGIDYTYFRQISQYIYLSTAYATMIRETQSDT